MESIKKSKLEKLIGYKLDTNQYTSKEIKNIDQAKEAIGKVIKLYGSEILEYMFLSNKRYSTFIKNGISLKSMLS